MNLDLRLPIGWMFTAIGAMLVAQTPERRLRHAGHRREIHRDRGGNLKGKHLTAHEVGT